jgi:hypothetical protein
VGGVAALYRPHRFELERPEIFEAVEEPAPCAEEDRHDVHLDLVELTSADERLGGTGAVDNHVFAPGALPGCGGALNDVGVEASRPRWHVALIHVVGEHEDGNALVVVAVPATGELERAPAGR